MSILSQWQGRVNTSATAPAVASPTEPLNCFDLPGFVCVLIKADGTSEESVPLPTQAEAEAVGRLAVQCRQCQTFQVRDTRRIVTIRRPFIRQYRLAVHYRDGSVYRTTAFTHRSWVRLIEKTYAGCADVHCTSIEEVVTEDLAVAQTGN